MISTGSLGSGNSLLQEGIRKIVGAGYRQYELEVPRIANMLTSQKNYEFDREVTLLGSLSPKPENSPFIYTDPQVGREKRYVMSGFGGAVRASFEATEDELYGWIKKVFASLGPAARETTNLQGAKLFNLADSGDTGALTGFDGLSLLHTTHTGPVGEALTYASNRTVADLSESVLQSAIINFEKVQDAQGNRIMMNPRKLLVAADSMFLVKEILQSQGKPYTADNTINVLRGILGVEVLHYATDPDRWMIQADGHDMNFFMRTAPLMDSFDDKNTRSRVQTLFTRFAFGFGDWRHVYGSPGA